MTMAKNTICVWYDKDAEAAAGFYAKTFPDSRVVAVHRTPLDYPGGKQGDVITVEFVVAGVHALVSTAVPAVNIARLSPFKSRRKIRPRRTVIGMRLSATAARRRCAAGVRTSGAFIGKSRRVC